MSEENRRKQREEATASSPMLGRRSSTRSNVQISPPKNVSETETNLKPENVSERETNLKPENVSERETNLKPENVSEPETKTENAGYTGANLAISDITPWRFANRPSDEFGTDEEWHEFVQSIKNDGVDQPVTVRPTKDGKGYELICGRRRFEASIEAGKKTIPCIIRDLDDAQAAIIQDRENELRQDLSTFSRAKSWESLLEQGVFKNKSQLGAALGLDRRYVHKVMVYNRIPKEILSSIKYCGAIGMGLAQEIVNYTTVKENQDQKKVTENIGTIVSLSEKISQGGFTAPKLKAALTKISGDNKSVNKEKPLPKNVGKVKGVNCFNVRHDSNGTPTISILKEARELVDMKQIAEHLESLFEKAIKK